MTEADPPGPWQSTPAAAASAPPAPQSASQSSSRAVTCPNCGGTVEIRAAGYSVSVACQYCGSMLDVANPDVALIERHNQAVADLAIPLGSRGHVKGHEYQMVGAVRRSIDGEGWDEYLLFNPYVGYRWLVNDEDGWSFGTMLTSLPQMSGGSATYAGVRFSHDGESWDAVVDRVVGEFYWRVQVGDHAILANYEASGATLSCETVADEVSWTVSEPIGRGEMRGFGKSEAGAGTAGAATDTGQSAFAGGASGDATAAVGDAPDGPLARAWRYTKIGGAALGAMIVVMLLFAFGGNSAQGFSYRLTMDGPETTVNFGPLEFSGTSQRVSIITASPGLDNAWIDTDITLVNRATQEVISTYGVVERYSGYDSDGSWSEGSDSGSTKVASVPAGTYDLVIDASAHSWPSPSYGGRVIDVTTDVSSGGVFFSNLVLALILLLIPPIFLLWRGLRGRGTASGSDDSDSDWGDDE
ncbi:MAG: DUF4178 domain-containing protein [Sphingopyxis sp.]